MIETAIIGVISSVAAVLGASTLFINIGESLTGDPNWYEKMGAKNIQFYANAFFMDRNLRSIINIPLIKLVLRCAGKVD